MTNQELAEQAKRLRFEAVRMVYEGKDGHPGPALSIADIVTVLYFDVMRVDPDQPDWPDRDRLVLSKGHACPIVYAALSSKGYFGQPVADFNLRGLGSTFQGHPVMGKTPGIDMTSGSLGNGIAIGAGMALAGKHLRKDYRVFVIVGDGELQEGIIWEGANLAAARRLDNLVVFVDRNDWQSGGRVTDIQGANNPGDRFRAFGWAVQEIDAHDIGQIRAAVARAGETRGRPTAIVCTAVKGKGLEFMEDDNAWHKGVPTDEQFRQATAILG
ncbi:MAG: transketolase [Planctomycetes bacterium]|nr:transketolase [Planctomycetota bacterium]